MKLTDDQRWKDFLGDQAFGAQGILTRYLRMKDDANDRAQTVTLDRRRFRGPGSNLRNTKTIGWVTTLAFFSSFVLHLICNYGVNINGIVG